jgi:hypothetical protein
LVALRAQKLYFIKTRYRNYFLGTFAWFFV